MGDKMAELSKKIKYWILPVFSLFIGVFLLFADIFIKTIIVKKIPYNVFKRNDVVIIKNFFSITNTKNTGAAWSIFSEHTLYLTIFTSVACLVLLFLIFTSKSKWLTINLGIILGGACGNLFDRVIYGYVTDYLDFTIFGYAFPVFNLADVCLVVGCVLLMVFIIFIHKDNVPLFKHKKKKGIIVSETITNTGSTGFPQIKTDEPMASSPPKEESTVPVKGTDFFQKNNETGEIDSTNQTGSSKGFQKK